ncbi:hypothetical protein T4D_3161 [Trichinella pseudospiralis]|uniref:Uncharacterized protein n=1 Tax=Trichinella pseudospiralis TaxID=6337 RepID=A0A0V1G504_TRIPS|nr:hypothetical protein T4D_3161 [Trichinella pseudospiralis]
MNKLIIKAIIDENIAKYIQRALFQQQHTFYLLQNLLNKNVQDERENKIVPQKNGSGQFCDTGNVAGPVLLTTTGGVDGAVANWVL